MSCVVLKIFRADLDRDVMLPDDFEWDPWNLM